jgi:ADP-ribosylglycohydrolase
VFRLPCLVLVSSTIDLAALSYEGAVIQSLMIGGCNSSRCSLVGAAVAAMQGQQSIPKAWINKVERGAEILAAVEHLA